MRGLGCLAVVGALFLAGCKGDDAPVSGDAVASAIGIMTEPLQVVAGNADQDGLNDSVVSREFVPQVSPRMAAKAAAPAIGRPSDTGEDGPKLAYSHQLSIGLFPEFVKDRFVALRDACINLATLKCTLVDAQMTSGDGRVLPSARVRARLPHDTVSEFKAQALRPGRDEGVGSAKLLQDSTSLEDLGRAVADVERRLASLKAYRDRPEKIAERPDSKVEELIRVANETSQVQAQIEALTSTQGQYEQHVATEVVTVLYRAERVPEGAMSPIYDAWRRSGDILSRNTARVLIFSLACGLVVSRRKDPWWRRMMIEEKTKEVIKTSAGKPWVARCDDGKLRVWWPANSRAGESAMTVLQGRSVDEIYGKLLEL